MDDAAEFRGTDRYEVLERLGTGGMGTVYAAYDRSTQTKVALKLLHQHNPGSLELFKQEFRNLQDIQHRNLISLGELREDQGAWFFTMELLTGENFQRYVRAGAHAMTQPVQHSPTFLARGASMPSQLFNGMSRRVGLNETPRSKRRRFHEGRLRDALGQLACGLAVLHRAHKVHSDIKPSNIIVEPDGRVVLLDFGIAVDLDKHHHTRTDKIIGTVQYMAPEQLEPSGTGPASDCYAIGVLIYEALSGTRPFTGTNPRAILEHKRIEAPPSPSRFASGIPDDLERLCLDLLAPDPDKRPGAEDILRRLGAWHLLAQVPSDAQESTATRDIFVGRQHELNQLFDASKPPIRSQVRVIVGASGVGKTALMRRYVGRLSNTLVLTGRCHERESVPFKGIDSAIEQLLGYLRQRTPQELEDLIPDGVTHIAHVFPAFGLLFDRGMDIENRASTPYDQRKNAFERLRSLFTRIARHTPVVIALDDMQFADAETWSLIDHLTRAPHPPPMLFALFMRPSSANAATNAATTDAARQDSELGRITNASLIRLSPLTVDEARTLAVRLLQSIGRENPELAEEIAGESEGHPLFIHEIVRYASEREDLDVHSDLLDEALLARFDRVSLDAHRILQFLAVAGIPMKHSTMAAASEIEFDRYLRMVSELRACHLVQISGVGPHDLLIHDHDRIRETLVAHLDIQTEQQLHVRLVAALEQTGEAARVPEIAAHHLMVGGRPRDASVYWLQAAEQAMNSLAFESAAPRYQAALKTGTHEGEKRRQILLRLAEASVNSGRGQQAGEAFLEVANATQEPVERMRCLYQAAEQLLSSGHIDQGRELLDEVLGTIDIRLPKTRLGIIWSLLWRRAWLRVRGYGWRERKPEDVSATALLVVDIKRKTGRALGLVEPVGAAALQCRALLQALRVGEPVRLGWCFAFEAAFLSSTDTAGIDRGRVLLGKAIELAERTGDESLQAWTQCCTGILDCLSGHYRNADKSLLEAERLLAPIAGFAWEQNTARVFHLLNLRFMGEFHEMRALRDHYLPDAIDRGDLHTETTLRRLSILMWLAFDDVTAARRDLDATQWNTISHDLQLHDWYEIRARTEIALYERDTMPELELALQSLAQVEKSSLIRVQVTRIEQRFLRGRVLLALVPERGPELAGPEIAKIARLLEREHCVSGDVAAAFLRAGLATGPDDLDTCMHWLDRAQQAASRAGAEWMRQIADYWRAQAMEGSERTQHLESSRSWMLAHGIKAPERLALFLLPTATNGLQR